MRGAVVGRDMTFDEAWHSLAESRTVLVEGPAGIGKTTLFRALLAEAERNGWLVLACAPAESEVDLPFAALADMLRPLAGRVAALPRPQRVAAEVVLLSSDADEPEEPVDDRVISAAACSLLDDASAGGPPVLIAVDDAPWLDRPSERALRFALRRLARPAATLVTCRRGESAPEVVPLGLDRGPADGRLTRIGLGPLGVGALHHILRARLGATLSRPLLARVAREAGGNPLLAIELARSVLRLPRPPSPGDDLPAAASMHRLVTDLLATLPTATRDAVRTASLLATPALSDLVAAGIDPVAFEPAEEVGLLAVTPSAVEFAHPVYASTVRTGIPAGVRRRLHRILAGIVTDPDEQARHLALCTTEPHAATARALTEAAARQHARGASESAAQLYERAVQLTPTEDVFDIGSRRLVAARCRFDSGDYAAARVAAEETAAEFTGDLRAESLLLQAIVAWSADDAGDVAVRAAEQALAAAPAGSSLAGRIHAYLAMFRDVPEPAREHAEAATMLLSGHDGDRALLSAAMLQLFFNEVRAGHPARTELLDRALELEGDEPSWLAGTIPAIWWKAIDNPVRARQRLEWMLSKAVARGDEPSQHELLSHLGEAELLAGRWDVAQQHIAAAHDLGEQLGTGLAAETWLAGLLAAHRGRLAEADAAAQAGLRRADELDDDWCRRINQLLAGFVALSAGRMADAAAAYGRLAATVDQMGLVEPLAQRFEPDWIEACVGAGDIEGAAAGLDRLAERHQRLPRPWTTLGIARGRALLRSATGADPAPALEELDAARAAVPDGVLPLDRARCLLVAGVVHRRARRKLAAREALHAAASEFDAIGAAALADRARAELARVGGRSASSTPHALTPTEERVARLAAGGRTGRAIADELFISPKTVEANLARVYRKLGISSRAELGAAMARLP